MVSFLSSIKAQKKNVFIDEIQDMVLSDQQMKVREIVEATGISQGTVFSILHETLCMKKISP